MTYPLDALLGLLALESHRHRCLVVGEDLGTVPEGFRERLGEAGVLSYCPLYFERRSDGQFRPPGEWQAQALAVVGTHDLPPLRAWWRGDDIDIRDRLGLYPSDEQRRHQVLGRAHERVALLLPARSRGPCGLQAPAPTPAGSMMRTLASLTRSAPLSRAAGPCWPAFNSRTSPSRWSR